jgi:hypothetical protein
LSNSQGRARKALGSISKKKTENNFIIEKETKKEAALAAEF